MFLTDTPGILMNPDDPQTLAHQLSYPEITDYIEQGVITGGMIPKVEACTKALDYGVAKTHIIDGRIPHALLLEVFTDRGLGTLITH